jgi:hypothetical protein
MGAKITILGDRYVREYLKMKYTKLHGRVRTLVQSQAQQHGEFHPTTCLPLLFLTTQIPSLFVYESWYLASYVRMMTSWGLSLDFI